MSEKGNPAARLGALIADLEPRFGGVRELDEPRPLEQLILLMLARGAPLKRARAVLKHLQTGYVDWNDVRVTNLHELAGAFAEAGYKDSLDRVTRLVELLTTLYLRFNRMNLDFLSDPLDDGRKRQKLFNWLGDRSGMYAAFLQMHTAKTADIVVEGGLARVFGRLGYVEARASAQVVRTKLVDLVPAADLLLAQFVLHVLADDLCLAKLPLCSLCPAKTVCPSAKIVAPKPVKVAKAAKPPKAPKPPKAAPAAAKPASAKKPAAAPKPRKAVSKR